MPQFIPIVALAHVGLTGLLFFVLAKGRPEDIASELIARYWTVLMVASLISALLASTALLLIVHSKRQKLAARIVRSGTLAVDWGPANARPWSIFLVLCAFGLVWWNAEVPAALYGNKRLRDHFRSDLESWFPARAQALALTGSSSGPDLVITGAVLNAGSASCYKGDQIFWRLPGGEDLAEAAPIPVRQGAPPQVLALPGSELVPLPVANSRQEDWLIAIALASGAPFPLLPAVGFETRVVDQGGSTTCEILLPSSPQDSPVPLTQALVRLANGEGRHSDTAFGVIDGGYSNVVPIAISKELGAKAVILINSTPQCPSAKKGDFGLHLGALPSNLGRLFGYLWERSQESDRMASDDLLITEIRPPGSSDFCPAPFLLQFTPKVIDSWLGATRRAIEQGEGIATVKSWGLPVTTAVPLRN